MKKIKKGFTLIEMLIVVVIIGVIMSTIFLVYVNMGSTIYDAQRIKEISQEILYTNTYMQNVADKTDFVPDYSNNIGDTIKLVDKDTNEYTIGRKCENDKCYIYANDKDGETKLTNPNTTYISSLKFVTIPKDESPDNRGEESSKSKIQNIYNHGFWMMTDIQGKKDDQKILHIQTFFDIRSY